MEKSVGPTGFSCKHAVVQRPQPVQACNAVDVSSSIGCPSFATTEAAVIFPQAVVVSLRVAAETGQVP
jgi:hypothetical protein